MSLTIFEKLFINQSLEIYEDGITIGNLLEDYFADYKNVYCPNLCEINDCIDIKDIQNHYETLSNEDTFTSVSVNFSKGEELHDITLYCKSDKAVNIINKIKKDHHIKKEVYENIHMQIGSDMGSNTTIEIYVHNSQYLEDNKKKKIIEYIDSIKQSLLDEIKKIE